VIGVTSQGAGSHGPLATGGQRSGRYAASSLNQLR
jgi:hypothetical protein